MRGVYVRPHKHVGKTESMHVVQGLAEVVFFDEGGTVREVVPVGDPQSGRAFYYRLASPWYHTLSVSTDFFVFHEVTNGPFRREDTLFAPWSPDEADANGIAQFAEAMAAVLVPKDR
jgi:cupin fold WbuC family metalloprotein